MNDTEVVNLTRDEIGVLKLVLSGLSKKEISLYLGLGSEAVRLHIKNAFDKLDAASKEVPVLNCPAAEMVS
jgi:DNA-binding NarL/FixJ family response regulator